MFFCLPASAAIRVLVDQVGYELTAPKQALVIAGKEDATPLRFALVDTASGKSVLEGELKPAGEVHAWTGMVFYAADFSTWHQPGYYTLRVSSSGGESASSPFAIQADVLARRSPTSSTTSKASAPAATSIAPTAICPFLIGPEHSSTRTAAGTTPPATTASTCHIKT